MTIPTSDAIAPRSRIDHVWLWVVIGACTAALPVIAAAVELEMRYVLYGTLAIGLIALTPYLAMLVGSTERLFWILFVLSLQFELALTPISVAGGKEAGPYGIMISPTLLCDLALIAAWTSTRVWGEGERLRADSGLVKASVGVFFAGLLSTTNAAGHMLNAFGLFEILSLTLTAVVACHACSIAQNLPKMRTALFVALFIQSALIVVEQVLGEQISMARGLSASYGWGGGGEGRFAGTFGAPSCAATFLVVCLLFLFRQLTSKRPRPRSTLFWLLFAFGFLALLLTRTRSEWIGFAIGCSGMGWQCYREGILSRRVAGRLLVGGLLALLIAWPLVAQRLADDHKGAADTRENLVWIAAAMIKAHPLTGVGLNTATNQVYNYAANAGLDNGWVFIVHNQFLLVAAETGLPGLAAFLCLTWVGLRAARRCARSDDRAIRESGSALLWSLVAMCWALNLDHVSGTMTYVLFWFLIGAACGLDILRQRDEAAMRLAAAAR